MGVIIRPDDLKSIMAGVYARLEALERTAIRRQGLVSTLTFPATAVTVTNTTGVDQDAYITNGTAVLTVWISGVPLMIIPPSGVGTVRIPAGAPFAAYYSGGAPAWIWVGS